MRKYILLLFLCLNVSGATATYPGLPVVLRDTTEHGFFVVDTIPEPDDTVAIICYDSLWFKYGIDADFLGGYTLDHYLDTTDILTNIKDVETGAADGQGIIWSTAQSKWLPGDVGAGGSDDDITDVIWYDDGDSVQVVEGATKYADVIPVTEDDLSDDDTDDLAEGSTNKYEDLTDNDLVDIGDVATGATDGQILKWNNSESEWQPGDESGGGGITQEQIQDSVGTMVSDNTETRIAVTYNDASDCFDFIVDDMNDDVPESGDFGNGFDLDADGGITDGHVSPVHLNSYDAYNDNDILTYDFTSGKFEWKTINQIKPDSMYTFQATIFDPDGIQATSDAIPILAVEAEWAPNGITVFDVGIKTNASSTYSVNFEEWTSPTDGSPSTIETVATSSSTEAEDDGTLTDPDIAAGSIIFIDLPDTDINWIEIWGTYIIEP